MSTETGFRTLRIPLTHGTGAMPAAGFGTLIPDPEVAKRATIAAAHAGFRHFDAAERYRNEDAVGEALHSAGVPRADMFITTKLWNTNHRPERVHPAFEASLRR